MEDKFEIFAPIQGCAHDEFEMAMRTGAAIPRVDKAILEQAILRGMMPPRLNIAYQLRDSICLGISTVGLLMLAWGYWWSGAGIMTAVVFGFDWFQRPVLRRYIIAALCDPLLGEWVTARRYVSLFPVPAQYHSNAKMEVETLTPQGMRDVSIPPPRAVVMFATSLLVILTIVRLGLAVCIGIRLFQYPEITGFLLGGPIVLFVMFQSLARLRTVFRKRPEVNF